MGRAHWETRSYREQGKQKPDVDVETMKSALIDSLKATRGDIRNVMML